MKRQIDSTKRTLDYEIDFMVGPAAPSRIELDFIHLMDDHYVALMPADHGLANRKGVRIADLMKHPFIVVTTPPSVRMELERAFARSGQELEAAYAAVNPSTIGGMVEAGLGITALPRLVIPALMTSSLRAIPIVRPAIMRKVGILRRANEPLAPTAEALVAAFRATIESA